MNYKKLYDILYSEGYHISKLKNMGLMFVDYICQKYNFNSILDVGCSQGLTVQEYQKKGKIAYGIDVSEIAINKSKELGIANCVTASVINIPFEDKKFDAVITCDVLEHLEKIDLKQAIDEIIRVTKKYLFIKVAIGPEKNRSFTNLLNKKYIEYKNLQNLHLTIMPLEEWVKLFESTNNIRLLEINKELNNILIFEVIN